MNQGDGGKKREVLYGTNQAAKLAGCDPSTLRDYARAGVLQPCRTAGGRYLFTAADIRAAARHRARRK